jgi:hypothetical protein
MSDTTPQLDTPRIRVTYQDGSEVIAETENPDMVFFDIERHKRNWPEFQKAPMLWVNYLAYSKLKRSGQNVPPTFDAWVLTTKSIQNLDQNDNESSETVTAFPTPGVAEPG